MASLTLHIPSEDDMFTGDRDCFQAPLETLYPTVNLGTSLKALRGHGLHQLFFFFFFF